MAKNNKIVGTWTAIPDQLLGVGFDVYEIIIISCIQSWCRQDKKFYESKGKIARDYNCNRRTIIRKFDKLEALGILVKGDRKGKGMWSYTVNESKLIQVINNFKLHTCDLKSQQMATDVTESYNCCNTELRNNTTKTSTKTSFREGDDFSSSSPSKPEGPSILDIELFAKSLS